MTVDTGGGALGLLVRLDPVTAPEGWTARQFLAVAKARFAVEVSRRQCGSAASALAALVQAAECLGSGDGEGAPTYASGVAPSPYAWTVAHPGDSPWRYAPTLLALRKASRPSSC